MGYKPTIGQIINARKHNSTKALLQPNSKNQKSKVVRISATRAKTLDPDQFETLLGHIQRTKHAVRDTAMVMLSFYCGLRAKEIAGLRWRRNILDSAGKVSKIVRVTQDIGKLTQSRDIPMHDELRAALRRLRVERPTDIYVIHSLSSPYDRSERGAHLGRGECDPNTLVQYMRRLYRDNGLIGCTSHSGRRTFGTNLSRVCNTVDASIGDVRELMGHLSLESTKAYLEPSPTQHLLVNKIFDPRKLLGEYR